MNKLLLLLFAGSIFLTSCNRQMSSLFSRKEKLEVIDPSFDYLTAKAKFKFDHNGKKIGAIANFRIQNDSIIWASVSVLGLEAARVYADHDQVQVLDRLKKKYYKYSFEQLSQEYGVDVQFEMLQSLILGNLVEPYQGQQVEKEDEYFTYTTPKGQYFLQNWIGATTMKLEKFKIVDENSENAISVNYSDFKLVDSQIFPNKVSAVIDYESEKQSNTSINITYNKMAIQSKPISFPFSIPSKYEKSN